MNQRAHFYRSISTRKKKYRSYSSSGQVVTVMQAAKFGRRYDPVAHTAVLGWYTTRRSVLVQCGMRSIFVVVADVLVQQAFQMPFIRNDHVVKEIPAAIANPTLANTVLPWTLETGPLWLDAKALHCVDDFFIEICTVIEDQVAGCRVIRKCVAQLLNNPGTARMLGHVAVKDSPSIMRNDEEAVKHAEGERRQSEEVHGSNRFAMVIQKCCPSLRRFSISRRFPHPTQYGCVQKRRSPVSLVLHGSAASPRFDSRPRGGR